MSWRISQTEDNHMVRTGILAGALVSVLTAAGAAASRGPVPPPQAQPAASTPLPAARQVEMAFDLAY
jgi:hypothetical protein